MSKEHMNVFDMADETSDRLLELAEQTISCFPILETIFDKEFLLRLIRKKHIGNRLLWMLTSKNPYTYIFWEEISEDIQLLSPEGSVTVFRSHLRDGNLTVVKAETELPAWFKRRGYQIELHPQLEGKHPDFLITSNEGQQVFFEIESSLSDESVGMRNAMIEIRARLRKARHPFIFYLKYRDVVSTSREVKDIVGFVKRHLKSLSALKEFNFPYEYVFDRKVILRIHSLAKQGRGYLGAYFPPLMWRYDDKRLREKIRKGATQLAQARRNVLVLDISASEFADSIDIEEALYGKEMWSPDPKTGEMYMYGRGRERAFRRGAGTRVGAVMIWNRRFDEATSSFTKLCEVYHNPWSRLPVSKETFEELATRHWFVVHEGDEFVLKSEI